MKLSVSAYRAQASAHKKILSSSYQLNYGSTAPAPSSCATLPQFTVEEADAGGAGEGGGSSEEAGGGTGSLGHSLATSRDEDDDSSNNASSEGKSPGQSGPDTDPQNISRRRSRSLRVSSHSASPLTELIAKDPDDAQGRNYGTRGWPPQDPGTSRRMSSSHQNWRNVRAVMAYYCSLRKIKRTKSNQRWMKLRTTVQLSSAISTIQKKPPLKREDSFLKRFSTRQIPETQETVEDTGSEGGGAGGGGSGAAPSRRRRRIPRPPRTVVNPDENFFFYWLWLLTGCVLYNLWTLIVRQSFPELQTLASNFWFACDCLTDLVFAADLAVQLRTGYLEQGLMVYDSRKLAGHYLNSRAFLLDLAALTPLDLLQLRFGAHPMLRFPRFLKVYRAVNCYYIVESRTVYPNFWRVINLIHILLILAHWFGCFYFLLSEAEGFQGDWVYPHRPGDYATLTRKYLGSLYWSTLTLTTIGDLPTPETNVEASQSADGPKSLPRRGLKSRLLQFRSNKGYVFTIVSYLIGVFIFATIVGQVGNVITNRNANRLEFERLLDGAKTYMRHHKVPGGMKRRVLRWYDYSWSRGRIQGGGDINTALGLLPDKLKTELALHVNLSVLKKVTIFQECQPEFLHDLVLKMKAYIFTPGDSICRKGEVAREMFIIADGILEVISETGRVLTTMKAGDFFGEIGILNLDGLNKRTADVRSVGYSELFSLSREDVLAAMKDYPEAQEILQTLGRKRLQEARNCNRKAKGETEEKLDGDDSGPRKIVHRLRSDVKGLRNALRSRSRASRRSSNGESLELRTLGAAVGAVGSTVGPKGVLRRMPRVESDETHHAEDEGSGSADPGSGSKDEKVISPLGAGLPLLARLKLLKERQEREEKEANRIRGLSIPQVTQPPNTTSSSTPSEPEIIGAGLPLLQRLLLLKAKEDRERLAAPSTSRDKLMLNSNPPSSTDTISPSSLKSPLSPTVKTLSPLRKTSGSSSPGKSLSPTTKPSRKNSSGSSDSSSKPKVSFKDKIMKLQEDGTSVSQPLLKEKDSSDKKVKACDKVPIVITSDKDKPVQSESNLTMSIPVSVVSKIKSPAKAVGSTFRDKLKLLQGVPPTPKEIVIEAVPNKIDLNAKKTLDAKLFQPPEIQIVVKEEPKVLSKKSWSKLKKAAILGDSKESTSSPQSSIAESPQDASAKAALCMSAAEKSSMPSAPPSLTMPSPSCIVTSDNNNIDLDNRNLELSDTVENEACSSELSSKELKISPESIIKKQEESKLSLGEASGSSTAESSAQDSHTKPKTKPKTESKKTLSTLTKKKSYVSVEDLSPEYGTLPFVKKLKILYERQKLEELEKEVKKTRSSSLDCGDSVNERDILTRSSSESSTMGRSSNHLEVASFLSAFDGSQSPLSPESNETQERRNLKSILKKLSEDTQVQKTPVFCPKEFKKLIRAPTIEGYAARHSKFSKSVTFNRDTLTSPPNSANELKPLFPISNPYQRLTSVQSSESSEKGDENDDIWACDDEIASPIGSDLVEVRTETDALPIVPDGRSLIGEILADKQSREMETLESPLDPKFRYSPSGLEGWHPEDIQVPTEKPKLSLISAVANQRKLFRGSLEEQEYFGEVLLGIKHVIQGHLHEVQGKFQDRFNNLEQEVRKRDEIITQLQSRIQELERVGLTPGDGPSTVSVLPRETLAESGLSEEDHGVKEGDVVSALTASSGSDDFSMEQGFMRGDSLDTVFTTSPPSIALTEDDEIFMDNSQSSQRGPLSSAGSTEEAQLDDETLQRLARAAVDLDLAQITDLQDLEGLTSEQLSEIQNLAVATLNPRQLEEYRRMSSEGNSNSNGSVSTEDAILLREKKKSKKLDLKLDKSNISYSRQRAAKLKERRSWEESSDQESMELQDLPRSISPQPSTCDEHALLSPDPQRVGGKSRKSQHHFHLFGSHLDSTRAKIKKTLSVDTGIHHTGIKGPSSVQEHRKFSLGSLFGYHRGSGVGKGAGVSHAAPHDSVVLDMGSEYASSDGNSSTSSSGESDSLPRTPVFEHFHERRRSGGSLLAGGGDWEVVMLAQELERREKERDGHRVRRERPRRSEPMTLRSLEEESDTPPTPVHTFPSPPEAPSPPDWLTRRSRGLILRAASLEERPPPPLPPLAKARSSPAREQL